MDAPGSMESTTRSTMIEDSMFSTANTLTQNEKRKIFIGIVIREFSKMKTRQR